jgi:hypothetical protein
MVAYAHLGRKSVVSVALRTVAKLSSLLYIKYPISWLYKVWQDLSSIV